MADNYKINNLYQGGYSSLKPNYGSIFTGYRATASNLGTTTDPKTANILKSMSDNLNPGQKNIELTMITPEVMESIPKQHLTEVNRLAKLTGVDTSVHGPVVEASGISREGFTESNREAVERQIVSSLEKAHEVNPKGTTITFHSSAILPAPEVRKIPEEERKKRGIKEKEEIEKMLAIDQESNQIIPIKKEERFRPSVEEGKVEKKEYPAAEQINMYNQTQWEDSLTKIIDPLERTHNMINEIEPVAKNIMEKTKGKRYEDLSLPQQEVIGRFQNAQHQLQDIQRHLLSLFDKGYKYGTEENKHELEGFAEDFQEKLKGQEDNLSVYTGALRKLIFDLRSVQAPQQFKPLDDFSIDKSTKTFGNAAFESYKKYKDNSPIISIENPPAGFALSRGEEIKEVVEKSRKHFVERAVADGMSESDAKKKAEKIIGATWDIGHINMLRKSGFSEKDIAKETERIAPYLKHVHLSDNFGFEHTELPMGMGNVPMKEMLGKLGKKGEEAKKIVEAGNYYQHFQTSPMQASFESLGTPLYSMEMAPYWNQVAGYQEGYNQGIGPTLPQINYETFGGGFSQLPTELGGQRQQSRGSRLSNTPME